MAQFRCGRKCGRQTVNEIERARGGRGKTKIEPRKLNFIVGVR